MTLHIVKLCVGCDSIEDLADWQRRRLIALRGRDPEADLVHVTRQTPRRAGFGPGSSIYWVFAGYIRGRQRIAALRETDRGDGISRCALVLDPKLTATEPVPRRPFQGWRYLPGNEAPADLIVRELEADAAMPPAMRVALSELRLI
jgi:hypothetical protein